MNEAMQCLTWLGPKDRGITGELSSLQSYEWHSCLSCSYLARRPIRAGLKIFDSWEHAFNFRFKCHKHAYRNGWSNEHFVRELATSLCIQGFPRHKPIICRTIVMNQTGSRGNGNSQEHWQDGKPSFSCETNNGFLGEWLKKLQYGAAGMFSFWSFVPVKDEFLDLGRELTGTSFLWEGWGTSLCWWANFVGGLPQSDLDYILDLLFDEQKGLGMNIARYNIGGGADLSVDTNLRPFADIPGFLSSPNGKYDWSADERQRKVLLGAKSRGADKFEAFSNSPPRWMTLSGSVTGNLKKGQDNLDVQHYGAFADYLTEVVRQYENEWNVHFDYLAPFNEPVEGFWNVNRKKPAQEGCNFSIAAINKIICKVKESLVQKGLLTEISGVDSWSLNTARVLRGLDEETIRHISQVNVHTYIPFVQREGDARRTEVRRIAGGLKKKLWMSEYGPLHWRGSEVDVALAVARHINLDINELQVSAWCYWQVLEVPGRNFYWGLLHAEFDYNLSFCVELKKQYYIIMHFSRWIRPGFAVYPVEGNYRNSLVIGVDSASYATLVMVFTSTSDKDRDISFDSSGIAHGLRNELTQAALFRTSETENHVRLPTLHFKSPIITVRIAAKSITTVIVSKSEHK